MSKPTTADRTRSDIRHLFDLWRIEQFSIVREQVEYARGGLVKGNGATVTYLRKTGWQTVTCVAGDNYADNLRRIFLFLDRIRLAEKQGVAYQGLSSSKDIVKTTADPRLTEQENLKEAYDFLGVKSTDPFELIEKLYKSRATYFHPDNSTGDEFLMKRLNTSFDLIKKERGVK
jgi:hypothetical protein